MKAAPDAANEPHGRRGMRSRGMRHKYWTHVTLVTATAIAPITSPRYRGFLLLGVGLQAGAY